MKKKQKKYTYLGYVYPSVPKGWVKIIENMVEQIDKIVRPWYIPLFILNIISKLANGGSVCYVKNWFWQNVLEKITKGVKITDIKDKYAGLRVYGYFNDKVDEIVEIAEVMCDRTCERCGSLDDVKVSGKNWYYNYCAKCREEKGLEISKTDE